MDRVLIDIKYFVKFSIERNLILKFNSNPTWFARGVEQQPYLVSTRC